MGRREFITLLVARRRPGLRRGSSMLLRGDLFRTTLQIGEALTVLRKLLQ